MRFTMFSTSYGPDGGAIHIRKATRAEPEQLAIYQALNINPAPRGISKTMT
jgi:hypothetical protein